MLNSDCRDIFKREMRGNKIGSQEVITEYKIQFFLWNTKYIYL